MTTKHRICGHPWTDKNGAIGSNHECGLEKGHVGDHDCISCHATATNPQQLASDVEKVIDS